MKDGFFASLKIFFLVLQQLTVRAKLRSWYLRALLRTILVAIAVIVLLLFLGSWGLLTLFTDYWGALATVVYVLLVLYISGSITATVSSSLVQMISGEQNLMLALDGFPAKTNFSTASSIHSPADSLAASLGQIKRWEYLKREYLGIATSLLVSLVAWIFLIFPFTIPIGVVIFAWAFGQENLKTADRILADYNEVTLLASSKKLHVTYCIGLGLLPATMLLIPIIGWITLPMLQVAGIVSVRDRVSRS